MNLLISQHIVNQTRQDVSGGVSRQTDGAAEHPVHTLFAIAEHVFNPSTRGGVFPSAGS
ncbi:MAG: hypothetical protein MJZ70_00480 [Bacteroidales bacterium]|nr:hypothetical protein [Bacteroidales bacterium]